MRIGLIGTSTPDRPGIRWDTILLLRRIDAMLLTSERTVVEMIGISNGLVCSCRDELLVVITPTSAAGMLRVVICSATADGEHPEESTSYAKRSC